MPPVFMCFVLLFERTGLVANTVFERHLDLHNTCHKEAADQYQILSANSFPVSSANVGHAVKLFNDGSKEQEHSSVTDRNVTLLIGYFL